MANQVNNLMKFFFLLFETNFLLFSKFQKYFQNSNRGNPGTIGPFQTTTNQKSQIMQIEKVLTDIQKSKASKSIPPTPTNYYTPKMFAQPTANSYNYTKRDEENHLDYLPTETPNFKR